MIQSSDLIALFRKMYEERWSYEWGAAKKGCVDCSGAFVYAYRQLGDSIYHGSNAIARRYVGKMQDTPVAGFAAFKWKKKDTAKYADGKGDYYHIGLVDSDGEHVLNAKGTKYGFCRDTVKGWHSFAPLLAVSYNRDGGENVELDVMYKATVTTKSGGLNLRSGPGKAYPAFKSIPKGEEVEVITEHDNSWDFIRWNGVTGYVSAEYLTLGTPIINTEPVDAPGEEEPGEIIGEFEIKTVIKDSAGNVFYPDGAFTVDFEVSAVDSPDIEE